MNVRSTITKWVVASNILWLAIWVGTTVDVASHGGVAQFFEFANIAAITLGTVLELFRSSVAKYVNPATYLVYATYLLIDTLSHKLEVHGLFALVWFGGPYAFTGIFQYLLYRGLAAEVSH